MKRTKQMAFKQLLPGDYFNDFKAYINNAVASSSCANQFKLVEIFLPVLPTQLNFEIFTLL